jgi:dTDP-D-glucose 4,6-dehydratase
MKILVTGGSGFIGSNLVRLLVEEKGESVINLDKLTYAGNAESLADLDGNPNYTFEQVDLCDAAALNAVFAKHRPDAVMHLAAESHVDRSIDGPGEFIQTNIIGTFNLLQASLAYWRSLPEAGDSELRITEMSFRGSVIRNHSSVIRKRSVSSTSPPTKSTVRSQSTPRVSPKRTPTIRTPHIPLPRLRPIISHVPGLTLTACQCWSPTVPTITGRISFPKN